MNSPQTVWAPRAAGARVDLQALMKARARDVRSSYSDREAMLYALSVGMGRDLYDEKELPFVVEHGGLKIVPTLATVVVQTGLLQRTGIDFTKVVHAEQELNFFVPLPPSAELLADADVIRVVDKGEGKGAFVTTRTVVRDAQTQVPYFESVSTTFARGDGGIGSTGEPQQAAHEIPSREPDAVATFQTRPDQSLWYRLNGDRNPLHTDAAAAARQGLSAPILHGLCTYGIACRSVLQAACDYQPERLKSFAVRFSQPVLIGDAIETQIWRDGEVISFRCRVPARGNAVVIDRGRATVSS